MPSTRSTQNTAFGLGLTQHVDVDLAHQAERLGFDSIWVGGHLFWHKPMLDPLIQLTAYASATSRIRLGTSILLLPLYHATPLAKTVTTLDHVSGGRVILGIGVGGENRAEFEASGVPVEDRGSRADESIDVLRMLWSGKKQEYHGRHYSLPPLAMDPMPIQEGGPPIWIGGRSAAALERVAHRGDGWIGIFRSPERYGDAVAHVGELCDRIDRPLGEITFAHYLWVRVAATKEEAVERARSYLQGSYDRPFTDEQIARFCATGGADELSEVIDAYERAGCTHFILKPACERSELRDQAEQLAEGLLPKRGPIGSA